ncbi:hypothetical protein ACHAWO_002144 [Cyclotella atomus]|jgi:hypothetical protein|uniref:Uncharacterized protein n=1 Tax=Cyclotella atomus TaxID=382360 RepID=A0ABD3QRV5_9STRA
MKKSQGRPKPQNQAHQVVAAIPSSALYHTNKETMFIVAISTLILYLMPSIMGFGIDHQMTSTFLHETPNAMHPNLIATTAALPNPLSPVFEKYMSTLASFPLPTKMLTGAALATAGDAIAQKREDEDYDASRGASFAAFDMIYRAAQHVLFPIIVKLCHGQYLLGMMGAIGAASLADVSTLTAMERSLASQLIIVPFLYYPVFFTFTGVMQGLSFEDGLERAKQNFVPLMKRNLLFWIPVQYVQFCYIPTDLQIPFLSCAGLAWTFTLSVLAGSAKKYSSEDPDHEIYCVIGTENDCVLPDDELIPVPDIFDDFGDSQISSMEFDTEDRAELVAAIEEERELVSTK